MNIIKFSKPYWKLQVIEEKAPVHLMAVFNENSKNFSKIFLNYDTEAIDDTQYELQKNREYLVLLFCQGYNIFTTIRTKIGFRGIDKEEYYRSKIGEPFKIVIKEQNKNRQE